MFNVDYQVYRWNTNNYNQAQTHKRREEELRNADNLQFKKKEATKEIIEPKFNPKHAEIRRNPHLTDKQCEYIVTLSEVDRLSILQFRPNFLREYKKYLKLNSH
jgi:hypothetical protein